MYQDFKDLLSAFHARGVKYLIVGGYAVSFHGQPRATKDLDLFIKADPSNAEAAYMALAAFGAPLDNIVASDFTDPRLFVRLGREPVAIDILPGIDGVEFESAWERRVEAVIDGATGLKANFISRQDLIASKLAAGRLRDLADVEELRAAANDQIEGF
ncbi:MAG: nucleotidyltransferase [Bryobacteraceae bacterium]